MPNSASASIYEAISGIRLIDPHTHINPYSAASETLADLLGYHYYTELAHSSGMPKSLIEEEGIPPDELVRRLVLNLSPIENTAQYRWLIEICQRFFGFEGDRLDASNWETVYAAAESKMNLANWPQLVLDQSNVESVFLTNDFDDTLDGFDTDTYIPCLRTDDLVFHLAKNETQRRLQQCSQIDLDGSLTSLRAALEQRFQHFVSRGARACAISLPPTFEPTRVADGRVQTALDEVLRRGLSSDPSNQAALSRHVFWTLAELCDQFGIPFDLMIGVNRGVYANGVFQGQDLYDSRVSLIQYRELFNAFPDLKFPISVLASVTNQELVSYSWIFPNVITNGHWWYSNTPSFITRDAAARLEAVPATKQIGYYSDAYKLEFVWPKFDMYRRVLSNILADHFVIGSGWSEERAIELGRSVLRDNVELIFPKPKAISENRQNQETSSAETWKESETTPIEISETILVETDVSDTDTDFLPNEENTGSHATDCPQVESLQDLDPLPKQNEIQSVGLEDVELQDRNAAIDDQTILPADMDPEPLDVGDLTGDSEEGVTDNIRMLRGAGSFEPDEDSLRVRPDPMTGELRFPDPSKSDGTTLPIEADDSDEYDTLEEEGQL